MSTTHHDFVVKHGLSLADDKNIKLGSSDEFKLYHTSSGNSIISETGGGSLYIDGTNIYLRNGTSTGEAMADFLSDGAVNLYYNNSPKLATTSSGVTVTGGIAATTSISLNGSTMAFDSGNDYMEFNKSLFSPNGYFVGTTSTKVGLLQNASGVMNLEATTSRQISFGNETNGEFVRIDATGNVGIGNTNPNKPLTITADSGANGMALRARSADDYSFIQFFNNAGTALRGQIYSKAAGDIGFTTGTDSSAGNDLYIKNGTGVGIGTTAPTMPLSVQAASNAYAISMHGRSDGYSELYGASNDGSTKYSFLQSHSAQTKLYTLVNTPLLFGTNSTERMRIDTSGNVEVRDGAMLRAYRGGNSAYAGLFMDAGEKLYIRNSWATKDIVMLRTGEVGIGTNSPNAALTIRGAGSSGSQKNTIAFGTSGWGQPTGPGTALDGAVKLALFEGGTQKVQIGMDANARLWLSSCGSGASGIDFYTGASNTDAPSRRLRIDQAGLASFYAGLNVTGRVGLNQTPLSNNFALQVTGMQSNGSDARVMYLKGAGTATSIGTTGPTLVLQNTNNTANNIVKLSFESASAGETVSINAINTNHTSHYGDMAFNTRGSAGYSEKMRIMANGNVGIGDSSPDYKLDIIAATDDGINIQGTRGFLRWNSGDIEIRNEGSYAMGFRTYDGSSALVERMRINSAGDWMVSNTVARVASQYSTQAGCGWYDADHHFEIATTSNRSALEIGRSHANDGELITFRKQGNVIGDIRTSNSGSLTINGRNTGKLIFQTGSQDRMIIRSDGNVGIGTNDPAHTLDILRNTNGDATINIKATAAGDPTIIFDNASANRNAVIRFADQGSLVGGRIQYVHNGDRIDFQAGSSTGATMSVKNGKVGIGTTAPSNPITADYAPQVIGNLTASNSTSDWNTASAIMLRGASGSNGLGFGVSGQANDRKSWIQSGHPDQQYSNYFGTLAINPMGGSVGIGTSSPTQKLEVAGTALVENAKLKAIAESNTDTAVDVFVYDTRKDSDGGAWRKRTQHTSWYNETLNTSTRGARKEFPSVAVIVAENSQVTIYDGDDPDMPMWMVFDGSDYSMISNTHNGITGTTMKNGNLVVISVSGYNHGGVSVINFISEYAYLKTAGYTKENTTGIVNRDNAFYGSAGSSYIVNNYVYDVAMTVLPNAPIDADTGLPVPTIAVATNGGVSVIKDNGTVVDIVSSYLGHETPMQVKFVGDKVFWLGQNNYDNGWSSAFTAKIPSADLSVNYNTGVGSLTKYSSKEWSVHLSNGSDITIPIAMNSPRTSVLLEAGTNDELILGGKGADDHGTVVKIVENVSDPESGMIAQIASDFATGYQVGDIKLAALSDTDTTTPASTNLVTNGTFASASNWTQIAGSSTAITGGAMVFTNGGGYGGFYQSLGALTAGKSYTLSFDVTSFTAAGAVFTLADTAFGVSFSGTGSYSFVTAPIVGSDPYIRLYATSSGAFTIDNVSVVVAESDRSWNGKGLEVFGTVNKTAVATGAELVSYRSNGSSYLRQPSAGGLTLTSDFSISWWQKYDGSGGIYDGWQIVEDDISGASVYNKVVLSAMHEVSSGQYLIRGSNITASGVSNGIASAAWTCMTITKTGGKVNLYTNGKLSSTTAGTCSTPSNPYSLEILRWSYATGRNYANNSEFALFRTSNTVPSAEQIAKMYNDEKHLFATNAKATLYGSSDAVTALAYDEDTELLHVGTSAGRSEFQGLNRVNNTTDAVGAAISASNSFIVEE